MTNELIKGIKPVSGCLLSRVCVYMCCVVCTVCASVCYIFFEGDFGGRDEWVVVVCVMRVSCDHS